MITHMGPETHTGRCECQLSTRELQGKGKRPVLDIAMLQERFTLSEVAADWHELMILQHIRRLSIARASRQWIAS